MKSPVAVFVLLLVVKLNKSYRITSEQLRELLSDEAVDRYAERARLAEKRSTITTPIASDCEAKRTYNVYIKKYGKTVDPTPAFCQPRWQAVELLPNQSNLKLYPSHVLLNRCTGADTRVTHNYECMVSAMEEITLINVFDLSAGQTISVKAYNHIQCREACPLEPANCNSEMEDFSSSECKCKCKDKAYEKCHSLQHLVTENDRCRCQCRPGPLCGLYRSRDPNTCLCACQPCLRKICTDEGMLIDETTCSCVHPPTTAPLPTTAAPAPTTTGAPTNAPPTAPPTTAAPTNAPPTAPPTTPPTTAAPTNAPSTAPPTAPPTAPSTAPPTAPPTTEPPTNAPPTAPPTVTPTAPPTAPPTTAAPTNAPPTAPTTAPPTTAAPTNAPTAAPTNSPTAPPTNAPIVPPTNASPTTTAAPAVST